ncbi:hypothetical protein M9458_021725, partial [Cirrhinus mrigala]
NFVSERTYKLTVCFNFVCKAASVSRGIPELIRNVHHRIRSSVTMETERPEEESVPFLTFGHLDLDTKPLALQRRQ